jgi:NADPH-dependent 2,4-dienoyl-CoA reductase/sulfur reductase-like enzyme
LVVCGCPKAPKARRPGFAAAHPSLTDLRTHVVVIGGGYAGTLAANRLPMPADVDITLGAVTFP